MSKTRVNRYPTAFRLGHITDVVVENMQEQMEEMIAMGGVSRDELSAEIAPEATVEPGQIAVITVAPGAGSQHLPQPGCRTRRRRRTDQQPQHRRIV